MKLINKLLINLIFVKIFDFMYSLIRSFISYIVIIVCIHIYLLYGLVSFY